MEALGDVEEIVVGQEDHKDDEGKHLHAYVKFKKAIEWVAQRDPRKWDVKGKHPNVQVTRSRKKTVTYCTKEDKEPLVEGLDLEAVKGKEKSYTKCLGMSLEQLFDEFGPVQFQRAVQGINLYKLMKQEAERTEECRGVWIQGEPGVGKSHLVETRFEGAYRKPQNKWWDGYEGQEVVILEDLDEPYLNHYLKIWADKWKASGEVKGGTVPLMHKWFVVTSNYSIEEIVERGEKEGRRDHMLIAALERRFKVIRMRTTADRERAAAELEDIIEGAPERKRGPD